MRLGDWEAESTIQKNWWSLRGGGPCSESEGSEGSGKLQQQVPGPAEGGLWSLLHNDDFFAMQMIFWCSNAAELLTCKMCSQVFLLIVNFVKKNAPKLRLDTICLVCTTTKHTLAGSKPRDDYTSVPDRFSYTGSESARGCVFEMTSVSLMVLCSKPTMWSLLMKRLNVLQLHHKQENRWETQRTQTDGR